MDELKTKPTTTPIENRSEATPAQRRQWLADLVHIIEELKQANADTASLEQLYRNIIDNPKQ